MPRITSSSSTTSEAVGLGSRRRLSALLPMTRDSSSASSSSPPPPSSALTLPSRVQVLYQSIHDGRTGDFTGPSSTSSPPLSSSQMIQRSQRDIRPSHNHDQAASLPSAGYSEGHSTVDWNSVEVSGSHDNNDSVYEDEKVKSKNGGLVLTTTSSTKRMIKEVDDVFQQDDPYHYYTSEGDAKMSKRTKVRAYVFMTTLILFYFFVILYSWYWFIFTYLPSFEQQQQQPTEYSLPPCLVEEELRNSTNGGRTMPEPIKQEPPGKLFLKWLKQIAGSVVGAS